jgi:serine/threonine-protein kinase RsbT
MLLNATHIVLEHDGDIVTARQQARLVAIGQGFSGSDLTRIATAISEIARNILTYAKRGEVVLTAEQVGTRRGILVVASDDGPGIANVEQAMVDGYSTGRTLGLGLPGAKRLMDEFEIISVVGVGTTVTMRKWVV